MCRQVLGGNKEGKTSAGYDEAQRSICKSETSSALHLKTIYSLYSPFNLLPCTSAQIRCSATYHYKHPNTHIPLLAQPHRNLWKPSKCTTPTAAALGRQNQLQSTAYEHHGTSPSLLDFFPVFYRRHHSTAYSAPANTTTGLHPRHQLPRLLPRHPRLNLSLRHLPLFRDPHRPSTAPSASPRPYTPEPARLRLKPPTAQALACTAQPPQSVISIPPHPPVREIGRVAAAAAE